MSSESSQKGSEAYRVLARKYRPLNFSELIGQDALVRTLTNAIESGRVAHAFMLTGVRGVGKTTTARIIAKALNYTGADGKAGPTTGSTDDCSLCQAISEDRHPDVIEMDAASHTGVDDIRDILDGVRYAPTEARYKVYIIDEVHMLSRQAFNALLKTLEEPPEHVKFIFATTEIRKVPITVLSRCQRFDLRRVDVPTLSAHFVNICEQEKVKAEDEAIALIARAADGSVRDGLSLLDQAISLAGESITGQQVKDMLGLADRARTTDLLEQALSGNTAEALDIMDDLYRSGADPVVLMQDLLDLTHILTRLRAVPATQDIQHAMSSDEMKRALEMSKSLSMPTLAKTWQVLLKGLSEVQVAPIPQKAAEMILIRLVYAADLPDPADLVKKIKSGADLGGGNPSSASSAPAAASSPATSSRETARAGGSVNAGTIPPSPPPPPSSSSSSPAPASGPVGGGGSGSAGVTTRALAHNVRSQAQISPEAELSASTGSEVEVRLTALEDIVGLLEQKGDFLLASQVFQFVHPVKIVENRLEMRPAEGAPPKLSQDLAQKLSLYTGRRWMVSVSGVAGQKTLAEKAQAAKEQEFANVLQLPVMREITEVFPEARLIDIKTIATNSEEDKSDD